MKNFFAVRFAMLGAVLLLGICTSVSAQDSSVPPAYVTAQRLQTQAQAAYTLNQTDTARTLATQAVHNYDLVVSSHAFGHTTYAQQSLHLSEKLAENILHDNNIAMQKLQTLRKSFPADPTVQADIQRVGNSLDVFNKSINPHSTSIHILGAILYKILDFLVQLTGHQSYSYWIAILMVSVMVKLLLTPLSNKQYASMKEQQKLQPLIKELQGKHKNDKELLGRKMMELYKEHGVNPAAGCLPMLVQLPILYLLYYMIRMYQYQFSHGTFLWIGSGLSHMFPAYLGTNLGQPDIPILLLYAFSMYVTQKMTITPSLDPQQAEQQRMMAIMTPFMTTYFFLSYQLPSAFVLYYLVFNILSTAQQKFYMRSRPGDVNLGSSGSNGDGGSRTPPLLLSGPANGIGRAKSFPSSRSVSGNGSSRQIGSGQTAPIAEGKNNAVPAARGVISPDGRKVYPKKKRR